MARKDLKLLKSLIDYIDDIKPYHTKFRDVTSEIVLSDKLNASFKEATEWTAVFQNIWTRDDVGGYNLTSMSDGTPSSTSFRLPGGYYPRFSLDNGDNGDQNDQHNFTFALGSESIPVKATITEYVVTVTRVGGDVTGVPIPPGPGTPVEFNLTIVVNMSDPSFFNWTEPEGRINGVVSPMQQAQTNVFIFNSLVRKVINIDNVINELTFNSDREVSIYYKNTGRFALPYHQGVIVTVNGTPREFETDFVVSKTRSWIQFLAAAKPAPTDQLKFNIMRSDRLFISYHDPFLALKNSEYDSVDFDDSEYDYREPDQFFITVDHSLPDRCAIEFLNAEENTSKAKLKVNFISPSVPNGTVYKLSAIDSWKFTFEKILPVPRAVEGVVLFKTEFTTSEISLIIDRSWGDLYVSPTYFNPDYDMHALDEVTLESQAFLYHIVHTENSYIPPAQDGDSIAGFGEDGEFIEHDASEYFPDLNSTNTQTVVYEPFGEVIADYSRDERTLDNIYYRFNFTNHPSRGTYVELRVDQEGQYNPWVSSSISETLHAIDLTTGFEVDMLIRLIPTYSVAANRTSMNEGQTVTFTVTTTNLYDNAKLYWTLTGTGITGSDFNGGVTNGYVTIIDNVGSVTIFASLDTLTEGIESFTFTLRDTVGTSDSPLCPPNNITINDTSLTPSYVINASQYSMNEGDSVTFTIDTVNVADGTTLYWTQAGTAGINDFTGGVLSGSFVISSNTAQFTRTLVSDLTTEGAENFSIIVRTGSTSGPQVCATASILISDTSIDVPLAIPTYSISENTTVITETQGVTFTVTTTDVPDGTVLHWTTDANSVNYLDFTDGVVNGTITINNNVAYVVRDLKEDSTVEPTEQFKISIRTGGLTGPIVAQSNTITALSSTYAVTQTTTGSANEALTVLFTVITTNVPDGTTLYWTTSGTATAADFTDNLSSGSVTINNNYVYLNRVIKADTTTEGVENFTIDIRIGSISGPIVASSSSLNIMDTSVGTSYAISISPWTGNPLDEVTNIVARCDITTTNVANGVDLYWTMHGTVNSADFFNGMGESIMIVNNGAVFTKTIVTDNLTEGVETFYINLRTGSVNGPIVATSNTLSIIDNSLTSNANLVSLLNVNDAGNWTEEFGSIDLADGARWTGSWANQEGPYLSLVPGIFGSTYAAALDYEWIMGNGGSISRPWPIPDGYTGPFTIDINIKDVYDVQLTLASGGDYPYTYINWQTGHTLIYHASTVSNQLWTVIPHGIAGGWRSYRVSYDGAGTWYAYVDGVLRGTWGLAVALNGGTNTTFEIRANSGSGLFDQNYVDNFRMLQGVCLTGNYTPLTREWIVSD